MDIISFSEAKKAMREIAELRKMMSGFKYTEGATAPSTPEDGDLWYDTSSGYLKYYRASQTKWVNPLAYE